MSINQLYSFQGNEDDGFDDDFKTELAKLFVQHVPPLADEMVQAYNTGNWKQVFFCVHKMKPSIELLNISSIIDRVYSLNKLAGTEPNTEAVKDDILTVRTVINECSHQLKSDFNI